MALVFCFQLGAQLGRTSDEAAAAQLEQRMAQMDEQVRHDYPAQSADTNTDNIPVTSVDRTPVAP